MTIQIRGYIATSADGYIATLDGSVAFLTPFQSIDCGYDDFIKEIDIILMGRKTYEVICSFGTEWPYPNQKGFIVSSNPHLTLCDSSLSVWTNGVSALIDYLQQNYSGNVWVVGGTQLQNTLIEQNLINRLDVFIMPVLLGSGIPLFPRFNTTERQLKSLKAEMIENKIIKQSYVFSG